MPVRASDHTAQRNARTVGQQGAFGSLFAAVDRGSTGGLAATWGFDQAAVHADFAQLESDDPVVGLQTDLLEPGEGLGGDPLITPVPQRGGRAGRLGDLGVGDTEHQHLDEFVEHDPVWDPGPMGWRRSG